VIDMGNTSRRLAADILGIGENRVWVDPNAGNRIKDALTRDDVRGLIKEGVIKAQPSFGVSRLRAREKQEGKRKGRRRGMGSRRGTQKAREQDKAKWMAKVRLQRSILHKLREEKKISPQDSAKAYRMVKGGAFKGKASLHTYLKENKMIRVE